MTDKVIELRGLSKVFKVYNRPVDLMWEVLSGRQLHRNFEALRDISLSIEKGSVVGLIGRNGAGKSTLLRIIAGTLQQSAGELHVNGRISAILELGTGFNPDYTGRENIYFGGLCMGLTRQEIGAREAEIIAFSELEDFIDQPFKTYSSGMQARLTFSVAVSIDPDILIVDEALSVGDAKFQLKSFDRMKAFRRQGKTILVVSHDLNSLAALCDRAILIDKGRVLEDGDPNAVGKVYHELLFGPPKPAIDELSIVAAKDEVIAESTEEDVRIAETAISDELSMPQEHRYGDCRAVIAGTLILDETGNAVSQLRVGHSYRFRYVVDANADVDDYVLGLLIRTPRGVEVMGTDTRHWETPGFPKVLESGRRYYFDIKFVNNFGSGVFFLTATIAKTDTTKMDARFDQLMFQVIGSEKFYTSSLTTSELSFSCSTPGDADAQLQGVVNGN